MATAPDNPVWKCYWSAPDGRIYVFDGLRIAVAYPGRIDALTMNDDRLGASKEPAREEK